MANHSRTQALLLISRLLDSRDATSPLALILDTAEQTASPLVHEYLIRAAKARTVVTYIAFETLVSPPYVTNFVRAWDIPLSSLTSQVQSYTASPGRHLLVFDTLYPLLAASSVNITDLLPPLITPHVNLVAIHHTDQPLPQSPPYTPSPFQLLHYLATTILTVYSLSHVIDEQRTRQRSEPAPVFGIHEEEEGVLQRLSACDRHVCVVEMEHRRKSGRAVGALFAVDRSGQHESKGNNKRETIKLLDDTSAWRNVFAERVGDMQSRRTNEEQGQNSTFDLGLTEKQRRDRDGIVLPYFDAQAAEGPGEGGRILYDMGVEDDFDEEEDEI